MHALTAYVLLGCLDLGFNVCFCVSMCMSMYICFSLYSFVCLCVVFSISACIFCFLCVNVLMFYAYGHFLHICISICIFIWDHMYLCNFICGVSGFVCMHVLKQDLCGFSLYYCFPLA